MQSDWSLLLNVVFLGIIFCMIAWRIKPFLKLKFKATKKPLEVAPSKNEDDYSDDILGVRKIETPTVSETQINQYDVLQEDRPNLGIEIATEEPVPVAKIKNIMLFLSAKGQHVFAGYELLQTLLACGLRFGDGGLFHRHQHASGQGPVLFSLAAATATGMFDLQNMGSMSVKGLCLFMELSGNPTIDHERYELFMQTAQQLAEELHADLLDERQRPIDQQSIARFESLITETMLPV
jgi:cell division protein ZipA